MNGQFKILIFCAEYSEDLVYALEALQQTISDKLNGTHINTFLYGRWSTDWKDKPLRAEIITNYSPVEIIDCLRRGNGINELMQSRDRYGNTKSPKLYYIVDAGNNNLFCNKRYCDYFIKELDNMVISNVAYDLKEIHFKSNNSDLSGLKILPVTFVNDTYDLATKLLTPLKYIQPWSPISGDGRGFVYSCDYSDSKWKSPEILFKALVDLRYKTNSKYSEQYTQQMQGITLDGVITCKNIEGQSVVINLAKVASIYPYPKAESFEIPSLRIRYFNSRTDEFDKLCLEFIDDYVETTSFVSNVLGITKFPSMPIHRLIPDLLSDATDNVITMNEDDIYPKDSSAFEDYFIKEFAHLKKDGR